MTKTWKVIIYFAALVLTCLIPTGCGGGGHSRGESGNNQAFSVASFTLPSEVDGTKEISGKVTFSRPAPTSGRIDVQRTGDVMSVLVNPGAIDYKVGQTSVDITVGTGPRVGEGSVTITIGGISRTVVIHAVKLVEVAIRQTTDLKSSGFYVTRQSYSLAFDGEPLGIAACSVSTASYGIQSFSLYARPGVHTLTLSADKCSGSTSTMAAPLIMVTNASISDPQPTITNRQTKSLTVTVK